MPNPKAPPPEDPKKQSEKFADLARELECDDDEAAFDERLKKLAKAPPAPHPKANSRDDA
ncbi:MAG: hypothetical protein E8A49_18705 [Phenylobacterium sp.]|nr:MAG: hypothetical protein E8A49_18705 [Phenylobacterium sp.]